MESKSRILLFLSYLSKCLQSCFQVSGNNYMLHQYKLKSETIGKLKLQLIIGSKVPFSSTFQILYPIISYIINVYTISCCHSNCNREKESGIRQDFPKKKIRLIYKLQDKTVPTIKRLRFRTQIILTDKGFGF